MKTDELALAALMAGFLIVDLISGEIRATRKSNTIMGCKNKHGYLVSRIHVNGASCQVKLHRVVWLKAHGSIPDGLVIDHINGKKDDNRLLNLRLVDVFGNARNRRSYRGEGNPACKINMSIANQIRKRHKDLKSYLLVCKEFGVSRSLVASIVRKEIWI